MDSCCNFVIFGSRFQARSERVNSATLEKVLGAEIATVGSPCLAREFKLTGWHSQSTLGPKMNLMPNNWTVRQFDAGKFLAKLSAIRHDRYLRSCWMLPQIQRPKKHLQVIICRRLWSMSCAPTVGRTNRDFDQ